jgi:hypothetical protein
MKIIHNEFEVYIEIINHVIDMITFCVTHIENAIKPICVLHLSNYRHYDFKLQIMRFIDHKDVSVFLQFINRTNSGFKAAKKMLHKLIYVVQQILQNHCPTIELYIRESDTYENKMLKHTYIDTATLFLSYIQILYNDLKLVHRCYLEICDINTRYRYIIERIIGMHTHDINFITVLNKIKHKILSYKKLKPHILYICRLE